jgi:hypothetical protein
MSTKGGGRDRRRRHHHQQQQHEWVAALSPSGGGGGGHHTIDMSSSNSDSPGDYDRYESDDDDKEKIRRRRKPSSSHMVRIPTSSPPGYYTNDSYHTDAQRISWINVIDALAVVGFIIFLLWTNSSQPPVASIPSMFFIVLLFHVGMIMGRAIQGILVILLTLAVDIIVLSLYIWYWQTDGTTWSGQPIAKIIFLGILLFCTFIRLILTLPVGCCSTRTHQQQQQPSFP